MVVCVASLIVFGFLGIFSVKYRLLAKEAFECVFRMVRLKPCDTGFDHKVKSRVTARLLEKNQGLARFTYQHFTALSVVFVVIFLTSMGYSAYAVSNLLVYGNCSPHSASCVLTPAPACGGSSCEQQCLCEEKTCETPEYKACKGKCDCEQGVCGES